MQEIAKCKFKKRSQEITEICTSSNTHHKKYIKNEIGEEKAQRKKHENERPHKKAHTKWVPKEKLKYIFKTTKERNFKKERKKIGNNAIIPELTLLQKMLQQC